MLSITLYLEDKYLSRLKKSEIGFKLVCNFEWEVRTIQGCDDGTAGYKKFLKNPVIKSKNSESVLDWVTNAF